MLSYIIIIILVRACARASMT